MTDETEGGAPLGAADVIGLQSALEKMIPRSLDDIVRANRGRFQIGLATADEVALRSARIALRPTRDTLDAWRIIAFRTLDLPSSADSGGVAANSQLSLLGRAAGLRCTRITSEVLQIDLDNGLVQTRNSLYRLGVKGTGEPPQHHLIQVCAAAHSWGFGGFIGAPLFF
jgi:hypothetical protein